MPSRSASRPRRSAPARCPSSPAPFPSTPRPLLRERAKHPGVARRCPGTSPARALRTERDHIHLPSSAQLAASGRNAWVPCNVARAFRPLALCALGATSLEARRQSVGPPPGLPAVTTTAPPPPPPRAGETPGYLPTRPGHFARSRWRGAARAQPLPSVSLSVSPSGRNTPPPRRATAAFRPLALCALDATSREARHPPDGPPSGLQAVTTTAPRTSDTAATASGRNTRVPRDATRAFRPLAGSGTRPRTSAHQPRTRPRTRPRTGRAPPAHGARAGRE
ncbi:hypothetical protein EDF23_105185 [Curtobacterium sp. PhB128]|nr:hypothetical protein EDF23_105185 [Curtobacterium sp. PhB128]TCL94856.1 hypothetical protein EDF29_105185 [Curtobacterium sp. PhB138]